MGVRGFWELGHLSDGLLRQNLATLLASGYRTEARIVAHLAELEERKLHTKEASESLFAYCTERLGLSNSEAFHRITVARIARRFPVVFELLERRALHLSAVCLLRDYLTEGNHRELLAEASHKTKWQVQELIARRFPRPDVASTVRKLPTRSIPAGSPSVAVMSAPPDAVAPCAASPDAVPPDAVTPCAALPDAVPPRAVPPHAVSPGALLAEPAPSRVVAPRPPSSTATEARAQLHARIEPISDARYRIQLNASASLKEKLDLARALISHSNPSGDIAVVIERALDLLIEKVQRQRFGKTERSRRSPALRTSGDAAGPTHDPQLEPVEESERAASIEPDSQDRSGRERRVDGDSELRDAAGNGSSPLPASNGEWGNASGKAGTRSPPSSARQAPRRSRVGLSVPERGANRGGLVGSQANDRRREHIPNATRREIAARDGLRCTFVGENGRCCEARAFLQIHHEKPWARGGGLGIDNLRLLCAAHNRLQAEADFGAEHVARKVEGRCSPDDKTTNAGE